jgi:hypothetical protein
MSRWPLAVVFLAMGFEAARSSHVQSPSEKPEPKVESASNRAQDFLEVPARVEVREVPARRSILFLNLHGVFRAQETLVPIDLRPAILKPLLILREEEYRNLQAFQPVLEYRSAAVTSREGRTAPHLSLDAQRVASLLEVLESASGVDRALWEVRLSPLSVERTSPVRTASDEDQVVVRLEERS